MTLSGLLSVMSISGAGDAPLATGGTGVLHSLPGVPINIQVAGAGEQVKYPDPQHVVIRHNSHGESPSCGSGYIILRVKFRERK